LTFADCPFITIDVGVLIVCVHTFEVPVYEDTQLIFHFSLQK